VDGFEVETKGYYQGGRPLNTKIVFFLNTKSFKGWLMKAVTGCYSYHCGFLMQDTQTFYDMFWMRRRQRWMDVVNAPNHAGSVFKIIDSPVEIPEQYLIDQILDANTHYGVIDYIRFGFRWAYHLVGKATPNAKGLICSEMVNYDLILHHWHVTYKEVPSPCDLIKGLTDIHCRSNLVFGKNVSKADVETLRALSSKEVV
jgi:hypothetical protein